MLCTYMRQLTKSYTMSFSIEALAFHAPVTCCTFVEHDSFSRTKEMVKSLECQNVVQNQYFNFSSGYMACNARQSIVSNNSSCLLKKIVLFHCKTEIKYLLFIPNIRFINSRNIQFLDPISGLMTIVYLEIDIDIVWCYKVSSSDFWYHQSVTFYLVNLDLWLDLL